MKNNPPPLFETTSRYTAPQQVTDEVYAAKKRAEKVVRKHPLPEGMYIKNTGVGMVGSGQIVRGLFYSKLMQGTPHEDPETKGIVEWDPQTGKIHGFYMHEDVRPYASHLLSAAHDHAAKEGVDGPTNSPEMTDYSYNMAKKLVPASIPKGATVGGAPIQFRQEEFLRKVHEVKSYAHLLEATGGQMHPELARLSVNERPSAHLGAALEAHNTGFHSEMGEHFENAKEATVDLMDKIDQLDHPHSQMLKDSWNGLLSTMAETRMRY